RRRHPWRESRLSGNLTRLRHAEALGRCQPAPGTSASPHRMELSRTSIPPAIWASRFGRTLGLFRDRSRLGRIPAFPGKGKRPVEMLRHHGSRPPAQRSPRIAGKQAPDGAECGCQACLARCLAGDVREPLRGIWVVGFGLGFRCCLRLMSVLCPMLDFGIEIGSAFLSQLAGDGLADDFGVASDGPLFATAPGTASFSDSVGSTGPPLGHLMSTPQPPGAFHYSRKCGTRNGEGETADVGWQMEVDTSRFDGIAAYRCLGVRTGSGIMEACPHRRALRPPRTTWATLAGRVYSVLQSKRPLRAPSAL